MMSSLRAVGVGFILLAFSKSVTKTENDGGVDRFGEIRPS
jgi:hypothetical protein